MNEKNGSTIYLLRHGETEWNTQKRKQGHRNSPLTERGCTQAAENGRRLKPRVSIDRPLAVISSPLGRAMQTASKVVEVLGLSPNIIECEDRLMECSFGLWEGLAEAEIKRQFPHEWAARSLDRWNTSAPDGESYADVNARVSAWYRELSREETTIVVCHGLTSRVFRGIYLGLSEQEIFELSEPQDGFFELRDGVSIFVEG